MHVPNVQPPLPSDYEVHPTHPIHRVPYQLAQFWDHGIRQRVEDKTIRLQATRKKQQLKTGSATGLGVGEVPRDLREATKRSPVVRTWVRALEEPVRQYICTQQVEDVDIDSAAEEMDSEDEEIVFVGRNGAMRELREKKATWKHAHREVSQETVDSGMVFDSFGTDESAAFKSVPLFYLVPKTKLLTIPKALAHTLHLRLLWPGITVRHIDESLTPRRLCRSQVNAWHTSNADATSPHVGGVLNRPCAMVSLSIRVPDPSVEFGYLHD
jgi:hypothetical protein